MFGFGKKKNSIDPDEGYEAVPPPGYYDAMIGNKNKFQKFLEVGGKPEPEPLALDEGVVHELVTMVGAEDAKMIGSRAVEDGFSPTSDYDFVVWAPSFKGSNDWDRFIVLQSHGFEHKNSSDGPEDPVHVFSKSNVDFMITHCHSEYMKFVRASDMCAALKLKERWQRISMYRYVRFGVIHPESTYYKRIPHDYSYINKTMPPGEENINKENS